MSIIFCIIVLAVIATLWAAYYVTNKKEALLESPIGHKCKMIRVRTFGVDPSKYEISGSVYTVNRMMNQIAGFECQECNKRDLRELVNQNEFTPGICEEAYKWLKKD